MITNGKANQGVFTLGYCSGKLKYSEYLLKNFFKWSKFLFLMRIFFFNFFICSNANAAESSEGRKL